MAKLKENFEFRFPLHHKVVRNLKVVTDHVGELIVTGTAYCFPAIPKEDIVERYAVDIDFVLFNGNDVKPLLEVFGNLDEVWEAAIKNASEKHFFTAPAPEDEKPLVLIQKSKEVHNA